MCKKTAISLIYAVSAAFLFTGSYVFASGEVSETGKTGMSFLKISPSAKITAMGSGATSLFTGAGSLWSNPALIAKTDKRCANFSHTEWVEGITQEYGSIITKSSIGTFGASAQFFSSGDIELRGNSSSDDPDGSYTMSNFAVSLVYASTIKKYISYGVSVKKLYEKYSAETAEGYAIDAGILVDTTLNGLSFSLVGRNYGKMDVLKNERTKLPSEILAGGAYAFMLPKYGLPCRYVGDVCFPRYGDSGFRTGIEVEPKKNFTVMAGYRTDSDIEGISIGMGFKYQFVDAGISYTTMKEGFDNALRFSLEMSGF